MTHHRSEQRDFKVVGRRLPRPDGRAKVTGAASYGADIWVPGMLHAQILRSPHAHARIVSIDTSAAEALPGVKAVATSADFQPELAAKFQDIADNCLARGKVLYHGHAVAAVAATTKSAARRALAQIRVQYEILPHVTDVDLAMHKDAPVLHRGRAQESVPAGYSENVTNYISFGHGDLEAGFAGADVVRARTYKTEAAHQAYIEPHACLATLGADGRGDLWVCTQGQYMVRENCAVILGLEAGNLRVTPSEIGGGFGGKTTTFIEPTALVLSRKAGKPVKLVLNREEIIKATGPTVSSSIDVKIGMTADGRFTAGSAVVRYQGGAFPCGTAKYGAHRIFATESIMGSIIFSNPVDCFYREL